MADLFENLSDDQILQLQKKGLLSADQTQTILTKRQAATDQFRTNFYGPGDAADADTDDSGAGGASAVGDANKFRANFYGNDNAANPPATPKLSGNGVLPPDEVAYNAKARADYEKELMAKRKKEWTGLTNEQIADISSLEKLTDKFTPEEIQEAKNKRIELYRYRNAKQASAKSSLAGLTDEQIADINSLDKVADRFTPAEIADAKAKRVELYRARNAKAQNPVAAAPSDDKTLLDQLQRVDPNVVGGTKPTDSELLSQINNIDPNRVGGTLSDKAKSETALLKQIQQIDPNKVGGTLPKSSDLPDVSAGVQAAQNAAGNNFIGNSVPSLPAADNAAPAVIDPQEKVAVLKTLQQKNPQIPPMKIANQINQLTPEQFQTLKSQINNIVPNKPGQQFINNLDNSGLALEKPPAPNLAGLSTDQRLSAASAAIRNPGGEETPTPETNVPGPIAKPAPTITPQTGAASSKPAGAPVSSGTSVPGVSGGGGGAGASSTQQPRRLSIQEQLKVGLNAANDKLVNAANEWDQGIQKIGENEEYYGLGKAGVMQKGLEDATGIRESANQSMQQAIDNHNAYMKSIEERVNALKGIDPEQWYHQKGVAGTIGAALAQAAGAFGGGLTHTPNAAAAIIDGAIQRNISAQQANLQNEWTKISKGSALAKDKLANAAYLADRQDKEAIFSLKKADAQAAILQQQLTSANARENVKQVRFALAEKMNAYEQNRLMRMYQIDQSMQSGQTSPLQKAMAAYQKMLPSLTEEAQKNGSKVPSFSEWAPAFLGGGTGGISSGNSGSPLAGIPKDMHQAATKELESISKWKEDLESITGIPTNSTSWNPLRALQGTQAYYNSLDLGHFNNKVIEITHSRNPALRSLESIREASKSYMIEPGDNQATVNKKKEAFAKIVMTPPVTPILNSFGKNPVANKTESNLPFGAKPVK